MTRAFVKEQDAPDIGRNRSVKAMGAVTEPVAIRAPWSFYNWHGWNDRRRCNAAQDVDHPISIKPSMVEVLSAVHFLRLYVLKGDQRNILSGRETVSLRPGRETVHSRLRPPVGRDGKLAAARKAKTKKRHSDHVLFGGKPSIRSRIP
jgi:hypothetical protein